MPGIVHVDVEAWLIGYLKAALTARVESYAASVTVRNKVPTEQTGDPWPASKRLIVVRDDGGQSLGDVRAVARVGLQVWAASESETSALANLVAALMGASENSGPVRKARASRPYSVTEISGRPKQYVTAELIIRGSSL